MRTRLGSPVMFQIMRDGCLGSTVVLSSLFAGSMGWAKTIVVDQNGAGEFRRIQPAIDSALDGDTVVVFPGEYRIVEPIDFNREHDPADPDGPPVKNLVLRSDRGPNETTIRMTIPEDPELASVVVFRSGEDERSALEGFTVAGGRGTVSDRRILVGGGILCLDSSPRISDCIVSENSAEEGGGLACLNASPSLKNCIISRNVAAGGSWLGGGGIALRSSSESLPSTASLTD